MTDTPPSTLKDILICFLEGEKPHYPEIHATILQANPFQISDDKKFYFDSCNLQELAESTLSEYPLNKKIMNIVLKDWNFVFRRVPGNFIYCKNDIFFTCLFYSFG